MARFIGSIKGARGEVTRLGTPSSMLACWPLWTLWVLAHWFFFDR